MSGTQDENLGLRLLKKGQKGVVHAVFSRLGLIVVLLVLQVLVLFGMFWRFKEFLPHLFGSTVVFTAAIVLYLLNSSLDATAKNTWLIVIMMMPVFGALLYWYTQSEIGHRAVMKRLSQLREEAKDQIVLSDQVLKALEEADPGAASLARYIHRSGCCPVYDCTEVTYFPIDGVPLRTHSGGGSAP